MYIVEIWPPDRVMRYLRTDSLCDPISVSEISLGMWYMWSIRCKYARYILYALCIWMLRYVSNGIIWYLSKWYRIYRIISSSVGILDQPKSGYLCLSRYLHEVRLCNLSELYPPICIWYIKARRSVLMSYKLSRRLYQVVYIILGGLRKICVCA